MPAIFRFWQWPKSPRRHARHVPSCPPTPARCPFFHSETPAPSSSTMPATSCPGTRGLNSWPIALFREHVAAAITTGLHFDEHMSCTRLRNLAVNNLEISSRLRNLRHLHWCYCDSCRCHKSSYYELSAVVEKYLQLLSVKMREPVLRRKGHDGQATEGYHRDYNRRDFFTFHFEHLLFFICSVEKPFLFAANESPGTSSSCTEHERVRGAITTRCCKVKSPPLH